jgi:hypothetical protein
MLSLCGSLHRLCDGVARREFLCVGSLGALGLSAPTLLRGGQADRRGADPGFRRARRCILLFLTGGASHMDTFDMKPAAPDNIRGEFRPIPTTVPEVIKDAAVNTFPGQDGGLVGHSYSPFRIEGNAERSGFEVPDVFLRLPLTRLDILTGIDV